jgi:NAD(P)-dependent dehydrogenase (short-subunit alcohol dehydrogenase family)
MDVLQGKVAVITGAGSGFGREFARIGAREGMKLVLADVQSDALQATADALRGAGADVIAERVDVAESEQVARLADRAFEAHGAVNLLINNAGVGGGGYLWESTEADWRWVIGVNLMGVVHGIRYFVPRMLAAERNGVPGHIVNTASMAGWLAAPLMGVYNVSKHAVVALSETLYHDLRLAQSALGVTVLCPAFVPTGIAESQRNRPPELANPAAATASQKMAHAATEKAVLGGRITAAEVAEQTFAAVRANRFYVFTHPKILPSVRDRFEAALAGDAPADPYAGRPSAKPPSPAA